MSLSADASPLGASGAGGRLLLRFFTFKDHHHHVQSAS